MASERIGASYPKVGIARIVKAHLQCLHHAATMSIVTKDFAVLMAQVVPALIVALVIQARSTLSDRLGRLKDRLLAPDNEEVEVNAKPTPRSRAVASHASLILNLMLIQILALLTLGMAEIYCVVRALDIETPGWTVGLTLSSVVIALAVLIGSPVVAFITGPGNVALAAFWQTRRVWRYAYWTWCQRPVCAPGGRM